MDNQRKKGWIIFVLIGALTFSSAGCEPFRKKFVRKKKGEQKEKFIPVLDPIDYPPKIVTSEDQYKHAYSMWKVWSSDYIKSFEEKDSDKKQKYALAQSLKALEDMKSAAGDERKAGIDQLITNVNAINAEYDNDSNLRSSYQIKSRFEKVQSQVRNQFSPKVMTDHYTK